MNKLKQNAFWVGLGVAGAALAAFVALPVTGAVMEKSKYQRDIVRLKNKLKEQPPFAGNEDIRSFEEAKVKLMGNYQTIGEFYSKSKDHLDRWFPELQLAANQDPARDRFMDLVRAKGGEIEEGLKKKGVRIGIGAEEGEEKDKKAYHFGFNWEVPLPDDWLKIVTAGDDKKVVKELQKRFWARERVANAILTIVNEGGKVNRVHDFRFFKKLHQTLSGPWEPLPPNLDVVHYMGVGAAQINTLPQSFAEYDLPQKLGRTLTFGFALELPYSQVPRIISEILNPAAEKDVAARLLVSVIGSHITIRDQNLPEVKVHFMEGDIAGRDKAFKDAQEAVKPVDVLLTVTCQIIDFEPSELKKFDAVASK